MRGGGGGGEGGGEGGRRGAGKTKRITFPPFILVFAPILRGEEKEEEGQDEKGCEGAEEVEANK